MPKELLLVKLPSPLGNDQEFFGVGYYTDDKFVFYTLEPEMFSCRPLRALTIPTFPKENNIHVLGKIEKIMEPKNDK